MSAEQEYLKMAWQFIDKGQNKEAAKILAAAVKEFPYFSEAFELLGDIFLDANSLKMASRAYQSALEISPENLAFKSKVAICASLAEKADSISFLDSQAQRLFMDFAPSVSLITIPERPKPFNYKVHCLGLSADLYVDGLAKFINDNPGLNSGISILAAGESGPQILRIFEESILAPKLKVLMLEPDQFQNHPETSYRRSIEAQFIDSNILAIHLDEHESIDGFFARLSTESPFFGVEPYMNPETQIVFLNYGGEEENTNEFANLNATLLVTVPRCGSGLFLAPFLQLASLNGRTFKSLSTNIARQLAIQRSPIPESNPKRDDGADWRSEEQFNLHNVVGLNFCEIGDLHTPYPIGQFSDIPFLDILVLMRDPRDVAVSSAMSYLYVSGLPPTKNIIEEAIESRIQEYLPAVLTTFRDATQMEKCYPVRYENLLADRRAEFRSLFSWLGWKPRITKKAFEDAINLTETYRLQEAKAAIGGDELQVSWVNGTNFRKGIVGDWKNHFTEPLKDQFKELGGQILIDLGYAENDNW